MLVTIKKWMAERTCKTCFTETSQDSTLPETGTGTWPSTKTSATAAHVRLIRASDLVARAAQVAPTEGFEACHSETVRPLRNTPQYHGGLSRAQCRDLPVHLTWKPQRERRSCAYSDREAKLQPFAMLGLTTNLDARSCSSRNPVGNVGKQNRNRNKTKTKNKIPKLDEKLISNDPRH
jgi:hypothetical protein